MISRLSSPVIDRRLSVASFLNDSRQDLKSASIKDCRRVRNYSEIFWLAEQPRKSLKMRLIEKENGETEKRELRRGKSWRPYVVSEYEQCAHKDK